MFSIQDLQPAGKGDVIVYSPYYPKNKQTFLPFAISLYQNASFEGVRQIEGSDGISFAASWFVSKLPSEITVCRLLFDGQAELSYEVAMANHEFVDYLIEVIINYKRNHAIDFPRTFYRKLLRYEDKV
jgi:hypothetical protein